MLSKAGVSFIKKPTGGTQFIIRYADGRVPKVVGEYVNDVFKGLKPKTSAHNKLIGTFEGEVEFADGTKRKGTYKIWGKCGSSGNLRTTSDDCIADDLAAEAADSFKENLKKSSNWWKLANDPKLSNVKRTLKKNQTYDFTERAKNPGSPHEKIKSKYGKTKVEYDCFGFPDFTPFVLKNVMINGINKAISATIDIGPIEGCNTGPKCGDFVKANQALANQLGVPYQDFRATLHDGVQYTWHHHQDGKTMMLVPTLLNGFSGAQHAGGASLKKGFETAGYELTNALPSPGEKLD